MTDEELVGQLRAGDSDAAQTLSQRYWPAIHRFCRSYLGDEQRAEDVTQETFGKLLAGELPEGALRPWLYKLARNRCLDILRRQQRSPTDANRLHTGFEAGTRSSGPQTKAARAEREELIRQIMSQMPEEYRSVLQLKYYESMSREEIAEALGVSDATVKGRLVRASEYLRQELRRITESFS